MSSQRHFRPWGSGITLGVALAILFAWSTSAKAELTAIEANTDAGNLTIYKLSVTPAAEPKPPLRHRLTVREIELKPGNAATHYLRAFPESGFEVLMKRTVENYGEEFHDWYRASNTPLSKLPLDKASQAAASFDGIIENFIAPATFRRDCDWGLGIEEMRGPQIIAVLLPEFQASRSFSRVLALRTRVAIAEGDYDRALEQLRMNYRLAQNVGSEPLLVCGLIGIAEAGMGHQQVIELIGAKDSPNLYWALAELPQPLVDIRKAVQFEMALGLRMFPMLEDAETATHTPEEWARQLANALSEAGQLTTSGSGFDGGSQQMRQAAVAGMSLMLYPGAKQRLIEGGMDADRVAAMPVGQVIAVDAAREYRAVADALEKWMYVPYHIARQSDRDLPFHGGKGPALARGYGYMLASLLLPAVDAARSAEARLAWQTRGIQVVEAIRMHAAVTGKLPGTLDEIKAVPLPLNPATNKPYQYRLEGEKGVLDLPFSDGFPGSVAWRFEITLAEEG